jgi:SAM-dependent methyltransferase
MKFHAESAELDEPAVSRLLFLAALRRHLHAHLAVGNKDLYRAKHAQAGDATAQGVAAAERRRSLRATFEREPYFQAWSATLRASQDLMWRYIGDAVDSDMPRLRGRYAERHAAAAGSVTTRDALAVPEYLARADTHRMPGSYFASRDASDLRAGALYDIGGAIYQLGIGNSSGQLLNDSRGRTLVSHLRRYFPQLSPARIADLGCGVGHNTVPLAEAFPAARVVGVDIGAAMVRFAHLRAEGLGSAIDFVQADAEATGLPAGSFDLVVSQIVLHETSPAAIGNVLRESARLLRAGGVAVHLEVPIRFRDLDVFSQFFWSWEQYYNNESNIEGVAEADLGAAMRAAGLADVREGFQPIPGPGSTEPQDLQEARPGMGGAWLIASGTKPAQ